MLDKQLLRLLGGNKKYIFFSVGLMLLGLLAADTGVDRRRIEIRKGCAFRHDNYNFNPRTPCGVRLDGGAELCDAALISIHAPRVGCDR